MRMRAELHKGPRRGKHEFLYGYVPFIDFDGSVSPNFSATCSCQEWEWDEADWLASRKLSPKRHALLTWKVHTR